MEETPPKKNGNGRLLAQDRVENSHLNNEKKQLKILNLLNLERYETQRASQLAHQT